MAKLVKNPKIRIYSGYNASFTLFLKTQIAKNILKMDGPSFTL